MIGVDYYALRSFIFDMYVFNYKMDKLKELYEKALLQIKEGKFKNVIFQLNQDQFC